MWIDNIAKSIVQICMKIKCQFDLKDIGLYLGKSGENNFMTKEAALISTGRQRLGRPQIGVIHSTFVAKKRR